MAEFQRNSTPAQIPLALSTMWGIGRFEHFGDFFRHGSRLGFRAFELNHKVNSQMLRQASLQGFSIPAIHEPCPADISTQTLKEKDWLISSLDETCRLEGVHAIQRSIDLAHELGARAIVIHGGHIPGLRQMEDPLWALFRAGQADSAEYRERQGEILHAQASRAGAVLEAVRRSMIELANYAGPLGIRLGLENRYHISDFPGLEEMRALLESLDAERVGFWFDVGHAFTLDRLGFFPFGAWPEQFGTRLIGAHLHDVRGLGDHYAPGLGEVDWGRVGAALPQNIFRTLEVHTINTPLQIADGVKLLTKSGCLPYAG